MNRKNTNTSSQRRQSDKTKSFKIILLGDSMVGKSSIIQRYIDNLFVDSNGTAPTLAWDFKIKVLDLSSALKGGGGGGNSYSSNMIGGINKSSEE
jgi:GTPase SAR1 family protein